MSEKTSDQLQGSPVPGSDDSGNQQQITVTVPSVALKSLRSIAAFRGVVVDQVMNQAIANYLLANQLTLADMQLEAGRIHQGREQKMREMERVLADAQQAQEARAKQNKPVPVGNS